MTAVDAQTLLTVCRALAEHGRELEPHLIDELEAISASHTLPWNVRAEAECLLELERMA